MANEIKLIETNGTYQDVPSILGSIDNSYAGAVVVSNEIDRTNGNIFVWKNSGTSNDGTVYSGCSGFWEMQRDVSYVDVKWFGAKGDYNIWSATGTDDTQAIQAALSYATNHELEVYLSKGKYRITTANATQPHLLLLGSSGSGNSIRIFGAGPEHSSLVYDGTDNSKTILKIESIGNVGVTVENFEIRGNEQARYGVGIHTFSTSPLHMSNMRFLLLDMGIYAEATNNAYFNNCLFDYLTYGLLAETPNAATTSKTLPNVYNLSSCQILNTNVRAAKFVNAHVVNFQSCDLSYNGKDNYDENTGALIDIAAIDCSFTGINGANGLNVKDCYFEQNRGLADIRVQVQTGGIDNPFYGTHTFQGNTFNRNWDLDPPKTGNPIYTNHNILITGSGQDLKRLFGQSKCKLVFIGNGFFVNRPDSDPTNPTNNYIPKDIRKAIEIAYHDGQYWEFDIVEEGNTYNGDPVFAIVNGKDAPVFTPPNDVVDTGLIDPRLSPQVSEFTRVKAFGNFIGDYFHKSFWIPDVTDISYNISSVERIDTGTYLVSFANELKKMPVITVTCVAWQEGSPYCIPFIINKTTQNFILKTINIATGMEENCRFDLQVF